MKRICLFAGYNYGDAVSSYVIAYLAELSRYADIYYMADGDLSAAARQSIAPYVKNAWGVRHGRYDFGSYSALARDYVGWETIAEYDALLLANDSCMCVNPFAPVFAKMDARPEVDFWGLLGTDEKNTERLYPLREYLGKKMYAMPGFHIGSYFLEARRSFFLKDAFQNFLNGVEKKESRDSVYEVYEKGILHLALREKMRISCYEETVYRYSSTYMREAFMLIRNGFPLLKVRIFTDNIGGCRSPLLLAENTRPFCAYPFLNYINEIRRERHVPASIGSLSGGRALLKRLVPRILADARRNASVFKKYVKGVYHRPFRYAFLQYITPPALHSLPARLRYLYLFARNPSGLRCSLRPLPRYGGLYPEHLRGYAARQDALAAKLSDVKHMVVFFNVMQPMISGGMLSVDRFVRHSLDLQEEYGFTVVQSGVPLPNAVTPNTYFSYASEVVDFKHLVKHARPAKLLLNIPECYLEVFFDGLTDDLYAWLWSIEDLRINILNQSDELMPPQYWIEEARLLCNGKLSMTMAHVRYCTWEKAEQYGCPVALLTPFLPEFYRTPFAEKEKIIALSNDDNPHRAEVVDILRRELPDFRLITIRDMTLEEYKKLISRAMFTVTFGEGYDGYFIEPYLSGSIGICVYNDVFFPKNIAMLPVMYRTWEELKQRVAEDIRAREGSADLYEQTSEAGRKEVLRFTNNTRSEQDLRRLYQRFAAPYARQGESHDEDIL